MAENMSFSVGDELTVDCLLEIFSYLSLNDMMQVKNVCRKWYDVSQHWFQQVQTLVVASDNQGCEKWELQEKYFKRKICTGSNHKKLISILHLCGHHLKYYKVKNCSASKKDVAKRRKLMLQKVPELCKNIVELNIFENESYPSWAFNFMATHWRKLEKLYIEFLIHPVGKDLCELLRNNQQLKTISLVFGYNSYSLRPVSEKFFTYLPTTIEEMKIEFHSTHDQQLRHFISGSKNYTSLRSLKLYNLCYLTDAVVLAIADIKSLIHLTLNRVKHYESHKTIDSIAKLKGLKSLDLSYNADLHENSVINIVESCIQLVQLDIPHSSMLTDTGMAAIAKLEGLKIFNINADYVSNKSIIDLCSTLEVFLCYSWNVNERDAKKFLKKATNLRLVEFACCKNLTSDMIEEGKKIANERKKNILCMTGLFNNEQSSGVDFSPDFREISTPYFKYFEDLPFVPLELFPNYINDYVKEYISTQDMQFN